MKKQNKRWQFVIMSIMMTILFTACGDNDGDSDFLTSSPLDGEVADYAPETLHPGSVLTWQGEIILTLNSGEQRRSDFGKTNPFKFQIISSNEGLSNYKYAYSTTYYTYKKIATNKANLKFKIECLLMGSKYVYYKYDMILDFTSPSTMNITGTYEFDNIYALDCEGTLILPMY